MDLCDPIALSQAFSAIVISTGTLQFYEYKNKVTKFKLN